MIAQSREKYAEPHEEVERIVAKGLGHEEPEEDDSPEGMLWRALLNVGLNKNEVAGLLSEYPHDRVQQQLDWLPERGARNPARYLLAVIRGDCAAPVSETDSP